MISVPMALATAALTATPLQTDTLTIRFIGNAAFQLTDGNTTLITDSPYQSGAFGYMTYDLEAVAPGPDAVSVITHRHADHFDASLFRARSWAIIGPHDVTNEVSPDRVIAQGARTQIGAFTLTAIETPHGPEHFSYLITWRGRRLYFTGDTEDPSALLEAQNLDVAFVTPWLLAESRATVTKCRPICWFCTIKAPRNRHAAVAALEFYGRVRCL